MVKIERQIVPNHIVNSRSYGPGNTMTEIAIHETANTQVGANAQAHSNLQINGNRREASWHYQVDDKRIIQSFEDNIRAWHAGNGNGRSIGIEICINRDGDFAKAVDNAAKLTQILMARHNIPLSGVKQHNHYTGKNCPTNLRNGSKGINWNDFINKVSGASTSQPKPSKPSSPKKTVAELALEVYAGKWGNNPQRKQRLEAAGYNYQAVQDKVDELAKQGATAKPAPQPKLKPISTMVEEVKAGKWGNGAQRRQRLEDAGYDYNAIQKAVNQGVQSKPSKPKLKSNSVIAKEVLAGKWGNGDERKRKLQAAGYNYNAVQAEVNKLAGQPSKPSKPKLKSVVTVAQEVIDNKWGNGDDRKRRLQAAGYNYNTIQAEVNKRLGATKSNKKSNETIAREVLAGKWGNGAERKRRLEAAGYNFNAIQAIVNRLA